MVILTLTAAGGGMARAEDSPPPYERPADTNFSQFPGFEAYLESHPPSDSLPSAADQSLLQQYRPRLYLAIGQEPPLDFYTDYIAQGRLLDGAGSLIASQVDRATLNAAKLQPRATFIHEPTGEPPTPTIYGRVDRILFPRPLTFLTYHAVFRRSGLPAGVPDWQASMLSVVADLDDWHQLDHYTAVSVVLDSNDRPFAVMLQQHNYLRTFLVGEALEWPDDDRVRIDIAVRSNELYLHAPGRRNHKAVRFLTPEALAYMTGFGPPPFPSADDVTDPDHEVELALRFLPPSDAFYVFRGYLGERRSLPGRDGPPGAFYNTRPELKPLEMQLGAGYWRHGSQEDRQRALRAQSLGDDWRTAFAKEQLKMLFANGDCLRRIVTACAAN